MPFSLLWISSTLETQSKISYFLIIFWDMFICVVLVEWHFLAQEAKVCYDICCTLHCIFPCISSSKMFYGVYTSACEVWGYSPQLPSLVPTLHVAPSPSQSEGSGQQVFAAAHGPSSPSPDPVQGTVPPTVVCLFISVHGDSLPQRHPKAQVRNYSRFCQADPEY